MEKLTIILAAATPGADSGSIEWAAFIAQKYANMFLNATWTTLYVAVLGTIFGFVLGFLVGVINTIKTHPEDFILKRIFVKVLRAVVVVYVEVFRDTPMIVQGMVIFFGLRQSGVEIAPAVAGILITVLNTGAYMGETVRAGINSVDRGQEEGALAMGMSHIGAMCSIILPQAFRNVIPEMGNTFVNNLKMTSVLNVIGVSELFLIAKTAGGSYYKYYESYLVIAAIYFVLCFVFNRLFGLLERKLEGKSDYVLATEYLDND